MATFHGITKDDFSLLNANPEGMKEKLQSMMQAVRDRFVADGHQEVATFRMEMDARAGLGYAWCCLRKGLEDYCSREPQLNVSALESFEDGQNVYHGRNLYVRLQFTMETWDKEARGWRSAPRRAVQFLEIRETARMTALAEERGLKYLAWNWTNGQHRRPYLVPPTPSAKFEDLQRATRDAVQHAKERSIFRGVRSCNGIELCKVYSEDDVVAMKADFVGEAYSVLKYIYQKLPDVWR